MPQPRNDVYARLATILSPTLVAKRYPRNSAGRSPTRSGASTGSFPPAMASPKWKAGVWATGFAALIMVGSLTGAQLKTDQQKQEQIQKFREANPEEQIFELEERRKVLVQSRAGLQRSLDIFQEKARDRALEKEKRREKLGSKQE